MNITIKWLKDKGACSEGQAWFLCQHEKNLALLVKRLIEEQRFDWANWVVTKAMAHKQNVLYACYSAKLSLHLFEKAYPKDLRPRKAIQAAMKWARNPSEVNRSAAGSAAGSAAWSAGYAAGSAAEAAAGYAAGYAAGSAAGYAAWSAEAAAGSAAWKKILYYGIKLLK